MATPPTRAEISGTPSRATANTGFGKLWDYVTGLLGSTGNAQEARAALGATSTGEALFTAATAAAARTTLGGTATGSALFTATDAAAARMAAGVPNSGPLSGLRNLVINGNFSVNQRGYVSGTATTGANQYTLDRWRVVTSGQAATFTTTGAGRTVTAPSGGIEQVIEGASIGGGTYVINWTGTASCTVNGVSRTKGATFTLTAGSNATVRFSSGTVTDVQIEPGEVATAFEMRPIAMERTLCQRYFCLVDGEYAFDGAMGGGTPTVGYMWWFQTEMRTTPTCSVSAEAGTEASSVTSIVAKSPNGAFVKWQWLNGSAIISRTKAVIVRAEAEL